MKSMPNFARYCAGAFVVLMAAEVCGQAPSAARERYDVLLGQELRVSQSSAATADDFRVVINRYWSFIRRYPSSGFSDNALWQAANLSADAFERFNQDRDKFRAVQLLQWLRDQYPHSPLRVKASARIEQLETTAAAGVTPASAPLATAPAATSTPDSTIRAVHREVLPDVVRITVELDREVPFYQERIEGPARLFFDLKGTKTVTALVDATFRYDSDIVRHIRLGRHPNSTTRVVLDLENVGRYSVFTLYNPYRIVIDAERSATAPVLQASSRPVVDPETAGTHAAPAVTAPQTTSTRPIAGRTAAANPITSSDQRAAPNAPVAPVAPNAPNSTIAGKPLPPSANSSGKFSVARQLGLGVSRIVIDAGHGGHDPGASAFGISEAELVLDVTLRLEQLLLQQEGIEVVLTRR